MDLADREHVHRWWLKVTLIAVGIFALAVMLASSSTLWDRDEPRFSRAAVEMLRGGDYLVPHFNDRLRPDKPAMIYWLMTASIRTLGLTELAVRLPSILGLVATSIFTAMIGRQLLGARSALWAMTMIGTAMMALYIGSAATADGTLLAWITLAMWMWITILRSGVTAPRFIVLSVALGAAQLTKGPVGLAVPVLSAVGMTVAARILHTPGPSRRHWIALGIASLLGIGMFLVWGLAANAATDGQFAQLGIGKHVVGRMVKPMESHGGSGVLGYVATLPMYLPLAIAGFFPWSLHLAGALHALIGGRIASPQVRMILWGWLVPTFVLMSLVATKLPHYILPMFPALALMTAGGLAAYRRGQLAEWDIRWLRGGVYFFGSVIGVFIVAVSVVPAVLGLNDLIVGGIVLAVVLIAVSVAVIRLQVRERFTSASLIALAGTAGGLGLLCLLVMPAVERELKPSPALAHAVHQTIGLDAPVFTYGYDEPTLTFYLNRAPGSPVLAFDPVAGIAQWAQTPGPAALVTTTDELDQLLQAAGASLESLGLRIIHHQPIRNYSSAARQEEVVVIVRGVTTAASGSSLPAPADATDPAPLTAPLPASAPSR
jgi:4-amino-4-deoxy-L-arabinose transferase-like glycosyltransferase